MEEIRTRVQELTKLVQHHHSNLGSREVSEHQYEAMFKKLRKLEKDYPEYADLNSPTQRLGTNTVNRFRRFRHRYPMLSFKRGNTSDVINLLKNEGELITKPNIDGLRITLTYNEGHLINAITKGNGQEGKDVTQNARTIVNIPYFIPLKEYVEIQGVIYFPKSEFKKLTKTHSFYKTPGCSVLKIMMLEKSKMLVKHQMQFLANYLITADNFNISYLQMIRQLQEMEFETPNCIICKTPEVISNITTAKYEGEIPVNGIIFRRNKTLSLVTRNKTKRFDPNALLWHQPKTVQIRIMGTDWSKLKNGNVSPSLVFETALKVNGSTYQKLNLKNVEKFKLINLHYNDTVEIDISTGNPKFLRINEELRYNNPFPIKAPKYCPECQAQLTTVGRHIKCINRPNCNPELAPNPDTATFKYQQEISCYGNWKFMHLKIVADFFGAKACRSRSDEDKPIVLLKFNSCNQIADINYTFSVEKMPVKVFTTEKKEKYEINKSLARYGDRCDRYFFYGNRYNTNLRDSQAIHDRPSAELMEVNDNLLSFSYVDIVKYSSIGFFFSFLASYKEEPLQIIEKDPNIPKEPVNPIPSENFLKSLKRLLIG